MNCHFNVKTIEERNNFIFLNQNFQDFRVNRILFYSSNTPRYFENSLILEILIYILFKRMCQLKYRKQVVGFMQQEKLSPV